MQEQDPHSLGIFNSPVSRRGVFGLAGLGAVGLALAACTSTGGASSSNAAGGTLIIQNEFELKTLDPARSFELTAPMMLGAMYESVLKYVDGDFTQPQPNLCSYEISEDNTVVTLTLSDETHYFSSGNPVTVDDIVFSFQRMQGIEGNPSFYLADVTVAKVDDTTLTLTAAYGRPELPFILPSVNLGILEKAVVEENGGTTDTSDGAETYLNSASAGSGPYKLDSATLDSQVTLVRNDKYSGTEPRYDRIVVSNVDASTQLTNIKAGTCDIATDINGDEAASLSSTEANVSALPSGTTVFLWFNANPEFGGAASEVNFVNAVRKAVNYEKYIAVYGEGSQQAYGVVPAAILGALTESAENTYDVDAAKELLAQSSYAGEEIEFLYSSDADDATAVAQLFQADMEAIGVTIKLVGQAGTTRLDTFRSGKFQSGVSTWGADYPDPQDYLVFTPNENISARAGWYTADGAAEADVDFAAGSDSADKVMDAVAAAKAASATEDRKAAYQELQVALNQYGPFVPLVNSGGILVTAPTLTDATYDMLNGVDVTDLV